MAPSLVKVADRAGMTMAHFKQRNSQGRDAKLVKLAIQTTRCSTVYSTGGHRKEGTKAPKPTTLPKLKCLERRDDEA